MSFAASVVAMLAGSVVFLGAVLTLARAVFRQASSTESNTAAIGELNVTIRDLGGKVEQLDRRVDDHEVRLAVLDDRRHRGRA